MILSRTAAAVCSARLACSSETMTSLNEIFWSPEANAVAFSLAEVMASSTRLIALLSASENETPAALGSAASGVGGVGALRVEIEESAESMPATAVITGIILAPSPRRGQNAAPAGAAAREKPGAQRSRQGPPTPRPDQLGRESRHRPRC